MSPLANRAQTDTTVKEQSGFKKTLNDLPFLFDDIFVSAGYTRSGLFWSPQSNVLNYGNNFQLGLESQLPMERFFFSYGLHYMRSTFHYQNQYKQEVQSDYLAVPLLMSFELPEFQKIDWRVLTGLQAHYRLNTTAPTPENTNGDMFFYNPDDFTRWDAGLVLGTSVEYRNFIFRARTVIGTSRVTRQIQGSLNTFHFELGYFLFRPLRNRFDS